MITLCAGSSLTTPSLLVSDISNFSSRAWLYSQLRHFVLEALLLKPVSHCQFSPRSMAYIPYALEVLLLWQERTFLTISFKPMGPGGQPHPCMLTLPHPCAFNSFPLQPSLKPSFIDWRIFRCVMQHSSRISRCNRNRITEFFACNRTQVLGGCRK